MAGQAARWMSDFRSSIAFGEDRERLAEICSAVLSINEVYVNSGMHLESLTEEKIQQMASEVDEVFSHLTFMLRCCANWHPCKAPERAIQQLAGAACVSSAPPEITGPAATASPTLPPATAPGSSAEGGAAADGPARDSPPSHLQIKLRSGTSYTVSAANRYIIGNRERAVCSLFLAGECHSRPGYCSLAHPCRFQGRCRNDNCMFDHPDEQLLEEEDEMDRFVVFGIVVDVCTFYMRGRCRFGADCRNAHPCPDGSDCERRSCTRDHPVIAGMPLNPTCPGGSA